MDINLCSRKMSGEVEVFQKIHNSFKKLQRLRGLVTIRFKVNSDVYDVFSSYLNDLLTVVSTEYELCVRRSSPNHLRFAAMQLALHYEIAKTSLLVTDTPKPSLFKDLEKCLREFADDKLTDEFFFIYFRALNYLWLLYASRFPNAFATAKDYSVRAEKMYESLNQDKPHMFYDFPQLFSKMVVMVPMESGREKIDNLFAKNLQLLEVVYQGAGDTESLARTLQHQAKIRKANVPCLIWLRKIVALASPLLNQYKLRAAAHYLIVASKMLRECSESDQKSDDVATVRLSLAIGWMNYAFDMLASSIEFLRTTFSEEELEVLVKFLPRTELEEFKNTKTDTSRASKSQFDQIGDSHAVVFSEPSKLFDSINLSLEEMSLCVQSIQDISTGQNTFSYIIDTIGDFIDSTDVSALPMNYIVYHYQLLDLLLIRSIFERDVNSKYSVLKLRFKKCDEMIQTLNEQCPKVFQIASAWISKDLNEIILDLYYSTLKLSNMNTNDIKMLREKVMELRILTLNTTEN